MELTSALSHLECSHCGREADAFAPARTCTSCGKVLLARYDLERAQKTFRKAALADRTSSMWRYRELLPVREVGNVVSLGEGWTPCLRADRLGEMVGCGRLYLKDEGLNPTGSFKARGLSAAVSRAKELGLEQLVIPSAGNAGGALAAYCAAGGMRASVFMPQDVPLANRLECAAYGAEVTLVDGVISDAGRAAAEAAETRGLFDVSTLREPYRLEGKKTMGFEIAEQFDWRLPDVIIYPTGGGTGLVGIWKAFEEMEAMGWIGSERPRMVCVQAEGCAPLVRAYEVGAESAEPVANPTTIAAGLRVPSAIGDYLVLRVVRASGGTALAVSDEAIVEGVAELAREAGVFAAPEAGATLAALRALVADGVVGREERVLLLITGSGLKYLDVPAVAAAFGSVGKVEPA